MEYGFWISAGIILYVYAGYPLILILLSSLFRKEVKKEGICPSVTLLIAAYNEEKVIGDKIENSFKLDYPRDKLEIFVVSDGSDDRTSEIVEEYISQGITFKKLEERGGKTRAIKSAFPEVAGEIVVLSDANTMYRPDSIQKLVRNFAEESVGAVSGDVQILSDDVPWGKSEQRYYNYERFLQHKESQVDSIIGVDGAMYAIRKELFTPPSDNIILDDFVISMDLVRKGHRVAYEPEAIATENPTPSLKQEFRRKIRIIAGGFQALRQNEGLPKITQVFPLFGYLSHKLLRWLIPFFLLGLLCSNVFLLGSNFYDIFLSCQVTFYLMALVGLLFRPLLKLPMISVPLYFCTVNGAALVGLIKGVFNLQKVKWAKVDRS